MTDLVFWAGPVAKFQVPDSTVPGAVEYFYGCYGDGAPWCPNKGQQLQSSPEQLLAEAGVADPEDVFLGAFSAGGSLHKRLLENPAYRDLVTGVFLADATYTSSWENEQQRVPPVIQGFADYAVDVARSGGQKIFVATASENYNKSWANGIENVRRIMQDVEQRTEREFEQIPHFFGVTNPSGVVPGEVWKLGNVIFALFIGDSHFGHGQTVIQGDIWQRILHPWLEQGKGNIGSNEELTVGSGLGKYFAFALGGIAAFLGVTVLVKR